MLILYHIFTEACINILQESDCYSIGVVIWEIIIEAIPWAGMGAVELFTTVVINRERLDTDEIPWSIIQRLIISLFTTQPIHRPTSDMVIYYLHYFIIIYTPLR